MFRSLTTRRMPKPFAIIVAALLALYFVPLNALPASAATIGGFEIDGNQVHDSAEDWKDLPAPTDGVRTSLPNSGTKTNRVLTTFLDNTLGGQDDTVSGSNNKENPSGGSQWPNWSWTDNGNATGKSDYGRVAAYSYVQPVSGQDHVFLVLGFDRGSNVGGTATANYYFELNQKPRTDGNTSNPNPNRQTGDIRITINDQGSGVFSAPVIEKWTATGATAGSWGPTSGQNPSYDVKSNSAGAINNLASWWTSVNAPNGTIDTEGFIEASLDLSSFGAVLGCPSTGFSTLNGRSSTGASDKNLVDYFKATPISVPSSCASLFITKFQGDGKTPLGGATFKITPNPLPAGADGRPNANFLTIFDDSDSNTDAAPGNYDDPESAAGLISVPGVIPGVEYTVTEESAPDGWIKDGSSVKVTPVAFGTTQSATNTASFTNHRGSVTFSKDYEGADPQTGASFILTRDNDDADNLYNNGTVNVTDNGANDSAPAMGVIKVDPLDAGSWKLVEDLSPGKVPTGWLGDATVVTFTVPDAQGNRNVTLASPTLSDPRAKYPVSVRKVAKDDTSVRITGAKFDLYKVAFAGDVKVGSCTTAANGECTVADMAWGFSYYWVETFVPAPYNLPSKLKSDELTLNADGSTTPAGITVFEDPQSKIVTQADNGSLPNAKISDIATLSGLNSRAAGAVTFDLYYTGLTTEPTSTSCVLANLVTAGIPATQTVAQVGNGDYTTGAITALKAGYYAWVAHYSGDNNGNRAVDGACDDANETSYVQPLTPGLTTVAQADDKVLPNTDLYDTAKVVPVTQNVTGNVDFRLYGPDDATCAKAAVFTSLDRPLTVVSDGQGGFYATATSEHYTGAVAGKYRWTAHFDGDGSNQDADSPCNATNEDTTVDKGQPSILTNAVATDDTLPGASVTDTATVSGLTANATGTVTFTLYSDASCTKVVTATDPIAIGTVTNGTATVQSGDYTGIVNAGTYYYIAAYSGDGNNKPVAGHCGDAHESVTVVPGQPAISTVAEATDDTLPGSSVKDTATVSGLTANATGTVTFTLYSDASCTKVVTATDAIAIGTVTNGTATVQSGDYTGIVNAGTYYYIASYSGDGNNKSVSGHCGDAHESVTVVPGQPAISTVAEATDDTLPGSSVKDTATVSGLTANATGTVTFVLYSDASCTEVVTTTDPIAIGTVTNGTATVESGSYDGLVNAGTYYYIASYSGDANNKAVSGHCGDAHESVTVVPAHPVVSTVAVASAVIKAGESISDAASVSGLNAGATGTVSFALYGPDDATCAGSPAFTSQVPLVVTDGEDGTATGVATSAAFAPTAPGTYRWVATYSGDDDNALSAGACNDPNEQSVVRQGDNPGLDKFSNPASGSTVQPGATIHYSVKVSNTGDVAITDEPVYDDLPPYVTAVTGTISDGGVLSADGKHIQWVVTLQPGGTHTFTYDGKVAADAPQGSVLVNTARFRNLSDTTSHVVPSGALAITKRVSPVAGNGVLVEFGDKLTYTLTVSATGGLDQPNVVVSDYLPGRDPAHPKSGDTAYVAGTATCIGAGTCTVSGPDANGLITWNLGTMAAGSTRQVTFQVTIVDVKNGDPGETVAVDIINQAAVRSDRTPSTPSNVVVTPVSKVLPVKIPRELPHTGASLPLGPTVGGGLLLLGLGVLLLVGGRRRVRSPRL